MISVRIINKNLHSFESLQRAYESQHLEFPGYRQKLASADVGWGVMILPWIERPDLWQQWYQGKPRKAPIRLMICPSDPPEKLGPEDGWNSYTVNTRICQDGKGLSLDYITSKDGTANTLLLSENLRSKKPHAWWDSDPNTVGFTDGPMADNIQSNHGSGAVVGFCDGHVMFLRDGIGDSLFKALVTPDGGEKVDEDKF